MYVAVFASLGSLTQIMNTRFNNPNKPERSVLKKLMEFTDMRTTKEHSLSREQAPWFRRASSFRNFVSLQVARYLETTQYPASTGLVFMI